MNVILFFSDKKHDNAYDKQAKSKFWESTFEISALATKALFIYKWDIKEPIRKSFMTGPLAKQEASVTFNTFNEASSLTWVVLMYLLRSTVITKQSRNCFFIKDIIRFSLDSRVFNSNTYEIIVH